MKYFMRGFSNDMDGIAKCPLCEKKYKKENAIILEAGQRRSMAHFTCETCRVSSLVFVTESQSGTVGIGMLTDLAGSEVKNVFRKEAISADQVLKVYDFFRNL